MSVNSKMTAIADKIRSILGVSGSLGLDAMASNLSSVQGSVDTQTSLIAQIVQELEGKAAGDSGGGVVIEPTISSVSVKPSSNSTSISFTGLSAEPKMFFIVPTGNITLASTRYVTGVFFDGTTVHGTYGYRASSSATSYYSATYFTKTYSGGTLKITTSSATNGGNFTSSATYKLVYMA